MARVLGWLHTRRLLLLRDNCEHRIEACAKLAEKLQFEIIELAKSG